MSSFSVSRALALIPFGYTAATRIRRPRDYAYLVASSWVPAGWMLWRLSDLGAPAALATFAVGYLAFISIYELGYFANDVWDSARSPDGRKRLRFSVAPGFALLFAAVRIALWSWIGLWTGWLHDPVWIAGYVALILIFALHNVMRNNSLRVATFLQLATLRFILPILGAVSVGALPILVTTALLLYTYLRTLSYMESKSLLLVPERGSARFGLWNLIIMAPLIGLLSLVERSSVPAEINLYFAAIYAAWWLTDRRAKPSSSA